MGITNNNQENLQTLKHHSHNNSDHEEYTTEEVFSHLNANRRPVITVYTDGACSGNPGAGGYAAIIDDNGMVKEIVGAEAHTTNNRMELMAAIVALEELIPFTDSEIHIYTDSTYLKQGITTWIIQWRQNNWRTADNKPVKNIDLWQRLYDVVGLFGERVHWFWVRGHSGHDGNEQANSLAQKALIAGIMNAKD